MKTFIVSFGYIPHKTHWKSAILKILGKKIYNKKTNLNLMIKMRIFFNALIREEPESGYSVLCPELGVASQGETIEEAKKNIVEAVELYFESAKEPIVLSEYVTTPLQACLE